MLSDLFHANRLALLYQLRIYPINLELTEGVSGQHQLDLITAESVFLLF